MPVDITWIGHASFRIAGAGEVVYIDPWKLPDAPHDATIVLVSHGHHDHLSVDDVAKVASDKTALVAPHDVTAQLPGAHPAAPGDVLKLNDVTIEAVASYNVGKSFHPRANGWIGAVIKLDGKRIYYAGDTDCIPEMNDLREIDLALLPVGGTYTTDAVEAAAACRVIGCAAAVPYHWGDIVGSQADAQAFANAADCPVTILMPGQSLTL